MRARVVRLIVFISLSVVIVTIIVARRQPIQETELPPKEFGGPSPWESPSPGPTSSPSPSPTPTPSPSPTSEPVVEQPSLSKPPKSPADKNLKQSTKSSTPQHKSSTTPESRRAAASAAATASQANSPTPTPTPTPESSQTPTPPPMAEVPSRQSLLQLQALQERDKALRERLRQLNERIRKHESRLSRLPAQTPRSIRNFAKNAILGLNALEAQRRAIRDELVKLAALMSYSEGDIAFQTRHVTFGRLVPPIGEEGDDLVCLTSGQVVVVSWQTTDPTKDIIVATVSAPLSTGRLVQYPLGEPQPEPSC